MYMYELIVTNPDYHVRYGLKVDPPKLPKKSPFLDQYIQLTSQYAFGCNIILE